jgi:phosphoenolpyruvate carboxykinase (diphosphate)
VLDRPGLARVMSLPPGADEFASPYLHSYRVPQGVLHNPKSDRRTTQGIFHIVEGGLPIPADKLAVPKPAFAGCWPRPSTRRRPDGAAVHRRSGRAGRACSSRCCCGPLVCPATGTDPEKTMEIRFFAPGSLVSNLDFVESIFGNGGDPYLPENDAALDVLHWTGHTGCVILAPHMVGMRKKDWGCRISSEATERQRRDGMCWRDPKTSYNNGGAFKAHLPRPARRDRHHDRRQLLRLLQERSEDADQLRRQPLRLCEEEHAGGAIAFPTYVLGQDFHADRTVSHQKGEFEDAMRLLGDRVEPQAGRLCGGPRYPNIFYVPEDAEFTCWEGGW